MSKIDTAALRALLAGASQPWDQEYVRWAVRHISRNVDWPDHLNLPDEYIGWEYMGVGDRPYHADADLIVAAVNALPDLLDVVDAARALYEGSDPQHGITCDHTCRCGASALDEALGDALRRLDGGGA